MTTLTGTQIGALIYANKQWGPGAKATEAQVIAFLDTAIAIALAESSGDPHAVNGVHAGLYQIDTHIHASKIAGRNIYDPAVNVDVARLVYQAAGNSFSPWQTYTDGAYKSHLGFGKPVYQSLVKGQTSHGNSFLNSALDGVINSIPGVGLVNMGVDTAGILGGFKNPVTTAASDVASKVASVASGILQDIMTWLAKGFLTIGAALLSMLLIVLGFAALFSNTKAGKAVLDKTKDAATVAAMA